MAGGFFVNRQTNGPTPMFERGLNPGVVFAHRLGIEQNPSPWDRVTKVKRIQMSRLDNFLSRADNSK